MGVGLIAAALPKAGPTGPAPAARQTRAEAAAAVGWRRATPKRPSPETSPASRPAKDRPSPEVKPASRPAEENDFVRRWNDDPELFARILREEHEKALRRTLRDPEGALFEWEPVRRTTDGGWTVTFFVNAKNGFGGYAGAQRFQAWFDGSMKIVDCREVPR